MVKTHSDNHTKENKNSLVVDRKTGMTRFFLYSFIGAFGLFADITIGGETTIVYQHIINYVRYLMGPAVPYWAFLTVVAGGLVPLVTRAWKKSTFELVFTIIKIVGVVVAVMALFNIGPAALLAPDMIPFLWDLIVVPISLMLIVGLFFLALLINYGILEFFSVFLEPFMNKIWKTPGESALDSIVSFSGGYVEALIVTNALYIKGTYSYKQAVTIGTGFATVSIAAR